MSSKRRSRAKRKQSPEGDRGDEVQPAAKRKSADEGKGAATGGGAAKSRATQGKAVAKGRAATKDKAGGKRTRKVAAREISAGGVVVRSGEVVVIVPTRRAPDGSRVLALPKGHLDPGESPLQAAQREVLEETGIVAEHVRELGEARYWYRRDGQTIPKSVTFYLFDYLQGDTDDHDDEVEEARWIALAEAESELTHAAEREMVGLARAFLEESRKDR